MAGEEVTGVMKERYTLKNVLSRLFHHPSYSFIMPLMQLTPQNIQKFQTKILNWYAKNKRDLPWREIPGDISLQDRAYRILVSEVMSQQTQVARVIPKYLLWLQEFPTITHLAKAKTADVLRLWSGLGYNRRALYLQRAIQTIVEKYHGEFPQDEKILRTLPGIGEYTARAVLCFAFGKQIAIVDTNVRKVILLMNQEVRIKNQEKIKEKNLTSYFIIHDSKNLKETITIQEVANIAQQLIPQGRASDWNQALMDYSAMVLLSQKVPVQKQSKFLGSNRYYRGKIIKLLLLKKKIDIEKLGILLKKDFQKTESAWLENIIEGLIRDGLVRKEKNKIVL